MDAHKARLGSPHLPGHKIDKQFFTMKTKIENIAKQNNFIDDSTKYIHSSHFVRKTTPNNSII